MADAKVNFDFVGEIPNMFFWGDLNFTKLSRKEV